MKKCYIICGGPETFNNIPIDKDSYIICADSGYDKALAVDIAPDLLIGDFDSIKSVPEGVKIIKAPTHKDDTDTMLAIKTAIADGYKDITLLSAFGGRMDHSLANLSALCYMLEWGVNGKIEGDSCSAYYLKEGKLVFSPQKNRYLSVFPESRSAIVSISGAEYEVDNLTIEKTFPIGVSNGFVDTDCVITVHRGAVFVLTVKK